MMMMGALHIEMAFINVIGDWLECSGWVDIFNRFLISTPDRTGSFLSGSHVKRSRYAHLISCAGLFLLLRDAHQKDSKSSPLEN